MGRDGLKEGEGALRDGAEKVVSGEQEGDCKTIAFHP